MRSWLLPEHIEDLLPPQAARVERLRRALLDLFRVHGFELIAPPSIEFIESLLTGAGRDLDLKTFKLVDQISGRMLGVRADITPQAARIDAHLLGREGIARLCYAGNVLHTLPDGFHAWREPIQVGAELYGHAGVEADIEIQRLLLEAFAVAGVGEVQLDIGHVGIARALSAHAGLSGEREQALFDALRAKDRPEVNELTRALDASVRAALCALPGWYGGVEVLDAARARLPDLPGIGAALDALHSLARGLADSDARVCFDLSELRGYHYHNGVVFSAYAGGRAHAVAAGGRYDGAGAAFGRARPATGFSLELRQLAELADLPDPVAPVVAPALNDSSTNDGMLDAKVRELRAAGVAVVRALPGESNAGGRRLALRDGAWTVIED
jgi:ATP phosphoribosyltransferase regulatory subunit